MEQARACQGWKAAEGSVLEDIPPTNISKSIAPSPLPPQTWIRSRNLHI